MDEKSKIELIKFVSSILDILQQERTFTGFGPPLYYLSEGEKGEEQLKQINKLIYDLVRKLEV